jgi:2-polyprenyl-3-methyl-5-hydroxy-6-metoxy-1,4-benzoquinol methylase
MTRRKVSNKANTPDMISNRVKFGISLADTSKSVHKSSRSLSQRKVAFLVLSLAFVGFGATFLNNHTPSDEVVDERALAKSSVEKKYVPAGSNVLGEIEHFQIGSNEATGKSLEAPIVGQGWDHPLGNWSKEALMERVGHLPQYLKDLTVQPLRNSRNEQCVLPGKDVARLLSDHDLLFFTNNKENEPFMKELRTEYQVPTQLKHIDGFEVFSAVSTGKSHSFHKHGESWLGQVEGRRTWWFLPPSAPKPERVNACKYTTGEAELPPGAISFVQRPGDIVWFPKDWYHATCALDDWTVGIGAQQGMTIRQNFSKLDSARRLSSEEIQTTRKECLGIDALQATSSFQQKYSESSNAASQKSPEAKKDDWKWFDGDMNAYYNSLEKDHTRDPTKPSQYAVHRWMGPSRDTEVQYKLLDTAVSRHHSPSEKLQVMDGGCGLGSGLMWMEQRHPQWHLTGYTVSEEQYKFINQKLPKHQFHANLESYDNLDDGVQYDFIYSIEAIIHSTDIKKTMEIWSSHLAPGGIIAIIDDFVSAGTDINEDGVQAFAKSWLANSLVTPTELGAIGRKFGLEVVENRDLDAEFRIIELNYKNKAPDIKPFGGRTHQGWMGSKWRQRLTVEGKLTYNMLVLQKPGKPSTECAGIPSKSADDQGAAFTTITPQLMSGRGNKGGDKMACISGWYCCNKGLEWYDNLEANRTDNTSFLKLDRDLFGHYIDSFTKHLNAQYQNYPASTKGGRFLDIGGTGSTSSGMKQVTSKFQHFAGPLEYWKLDSDSAAKSLERTLHCDIDDCPQAETCGFDVTFSHTVLEHAQRPWEAFDTIARITKKGGLTMHLVPFSYQYHATPDDNYRFSHKALISLLEDRGFDVLEVGYDICTKPEGMLRRVDEHYDEIWLTYVIGRKR